MDVSSKSWEQIACLIREAGKGPQGWTSPAAAAAAAARASSACATPMGAAAASRLDIEVHDTVAAAAALLELSSGRKRRLTFDHTQEYSQTDSEDAGSPPVHSFKPMFKPVFRDADADGMSDGSQHSSDHTCMGGAASPGSTAVSKQQRLHSPPAACNTALAGPFSPATPASASSPASAAAAAAAAAALAVSNAGSSPPPVELLAHQRRVQLHMIEQMLDATNTKFSTNNGVVAPRKFWPRLEGGDTAPTQLQVLVHPPSWSTSDYVTSSLERLASAVAANDSAALAADDGSTIAYAVLWKHYLEQTEADELQQHHRLQSNSKGNLHAATARGRSLIFGPYPALVVAGGSMMRIRGIKHNGELKMLINTPHTLVLREKLGAHMLRLHVVLNAPDGEDLATTTNHADLAVLTGKAGQERKNRYMLQQAYQQAAAATPVTSSGGASPPASGSQQRRVTPGPSPSTANTAEPLSADSMPHLMALAGEMAAAAAAAAGVSAGQAVGAEPAPEDVAQAVAAAMAALRRRQQEVQQQQGME